MAGHEPADPRTGKNGRHAMRGLFRRSVFGRLGGHEDVNDADRPGCDPAMRWIVGGRGVLQLVVERYRERGLRRCFRGDAAFAAPEIHEFPETEGDRYTIRLKADAILRQSIACLPTRPVGRLPDHMIRPMPASAIRQAHGTRSVGSSSGSNDIRANVSRASASSSPGWAALPGAWSPSATGAARPGSTSRKAGTRLCAPGCHAGGSGTMPCGSGFMRSPEIPVTSCGRRLCRRRSGDGRRPA